MAISPEDRERLVGDGCVTERELTCAVCRQVIEAGDAVHCNDGYDRMYGEFVLGPQDDLHEDNWPSAHQKCAAGEAHPPPRHAKVHVPRAVVAGTNPEVARLARARVLGTAGLIAAAAAAAGATYWGGVGAGALVFGTIAGLFLVAWGLAARPRGD